MIVLRRRSRYAIWWLCALFCGACGGASPAAPSTTSPVATQPTTPTPVVPTWSFSGSVVDTLSKQPIGQAHLSGFDVSTDGSGMFTATGTGTRATQRVTIDAPGHVSRVTTISAGTTAPTLDLFPSSLLSFYRQLVRDTYEQPGLFRSVRRWTTNPNFYINTTWTNNRTVDPTETLAIVVNALRTGVSTWTGGRLTTGTIETGTTDRAAQSGWVVVDFKLTDNLSCGRASVGSNPGTMSLHNDYCACGSIKMAPATVMHELGHVLGFFHVADQANLMYPQSNGTCGPASPSSSELQGAAVAYSRPIGNTDPDVDPTGQSFVQPVMATN